MPEDRKHVDASFVMYDVLKFGFADRATIGCSQFVYWNGSDPRRTVAPDAFVYWGTPDATFKTWKTWERGTPSLAIEIISPTDRSDTSWMDKLEKYRELGVQELVRFDGDAAPGARVRVWDRIDDDLVERQVLSDVTPCRTLSSKRHAEEMLYWVVAQEEEILVLRLARDTAGKDLLPTKADAVQQRARAAEADADAERQRARAAEADADAERQRARAAEADADVERQRARAAEADADVERQRARAAETRLAELEALLHVKMKGE